MIDGGGDAAAVNAKVSAQLGILNSSTSIMLGKPVQLLFKDALAYKAHKSKEDLNPDLFRLENKIP